MIEIRCPCCNRILFRLADSARTEFHLEIKCPRLRSRISQSAHHSGIIEVVAQQNEGFRISEIIE